MPEFRYDPFNHPAAALPEAEQQREYFVLLVQNLEAKCQAAPPLSDEFEQTVDLLHRAQEALKRAGQTAALLRYKKHLEECAADMNTDP